MHYKCSKGSVNFDAPNMPISFMSKAVTEEEPDAVLEKSNEDDE